jgi:murein DD-endopeptidase MepM/ murein hydrolase activator NlpD
MNNITNSNQLVAGQRIYIPNDRKTYAAKWWPKESKKSTKSAKKDDSGNIVVQHGKFIWPIDGIVTSGYGVRRGRRHDGIDISASSGTPIHAVDGGKVVFSSRLRGYGNLVLVKHKKDFFTVYAHNSRNIVKKGTIVKKGQVIARVGSSGRASGPHLHFEVRKGSRARNPLFFLPKQATSVAKK